MYDQSIIAVKRATLAHLLLFSVRTEKKAVFLFASFFFVPKEKARKSDQKYLENISGIGVKSVLFCARSHASTSVSRYAASIPPL